MIVQRGGQTLHGLAGRGAHLAHHMHGVDPSGRRQGEHVFGHFHGFRHHLFGFDDAIQETDLMKPFGGEAEAQRHFQRHRVRNVGDMAVVVAAEQPAFGLGHFENSGASGDTQIGTFHQHESAAHGEAVDRGDHRLFQRAGHERVFQRRARAAGPVGGERFLHILAGAETATGAGEDGDFQLVGMAKLGPCLGQQGAHFVIEGVQCLGPVHPDDEDLAVAFGFDDGHGWLPS